ncbi:MAG: methyltransferase domain-containing protein [Bacteroidales bacterium]|nr:methyltransferase domain-containing protein [Bacteroidales bacterium]
MSEHKELYYKAVTDYYDKDADMNFEASAEVNPLLGRIRDDFRRITVHYPFSRALEIGCGPGFDVAWFASRYPDREITGVDISENMVSLAQKRINAQNLANAKVFQADERSLLTKFGKGSFDLVFVYFGALNTVADLPAAAGQIRELLQPGGHAVLTFVNKWYWREMFVQIMKFNFRLAFARLKKEWGGYSTDRHLPSRCYTPHEIRRAFKDFQLLEKRGYSIFYPAWYNYRKWLNKIPATDTRWKRDESLQGTFLWSKGEYTLFVFKKA